MQIPDMPGLGPDPDEALMRYRVLAYPPRNVTETKTGASHDIFVTRAGPRMSQVVIHGNTVYLAGVVARNASGKSMTEQTQDVLEIDRRLSGAGRHRQVEAALRHYLDHRHGEIRRNERRVGRLGVARQHARARDCRGEARRARLSRRDHGGGGEVAPPRSSF